MFAGSSLEERCYRILEEKGGKIADRARAILLNEKSLEGLQQPLRYASGKWRDPLTPSLVVLSCEAVGGKPDEATYQAALAMTLMSLSFNLWDDIVDKTMYKLFIPTVLGKFGEGITLMIGGLASAKAFSILSEIKIDRKKRQTITKLIWDYWKKLAKAETTNLELRRGGDFKPEERLKVIEMQAINLETSLKIGAVLGDGSEDEITHLGNYGRCLGTILELIKDFKVSINLTLELAEKIRSGALPYTLLWAKNHSEKLREYPSLLTDTITPVDIKNIVEAVLKAKALEDTIRLLNILTKKAEIELLELNNNKAINTLKIFLRAQSKIFNESLSTLLL